MKVTMTVKTAPENSGLVKVQLSNLINVSISHFFSGESEDAVKTAPENSGLASYQISQIYQYHNFLSGETDDDCEDCPRELWLGQGSADRSKKCINITNFSGESDDACKDCARELWFGQGSVIKS